MRLGSYLLGWGALSAAGVAAVALWGARPAAAGGGLGTAAGVDLAGLVLLHRNLTTAPSRFMALWLGLFPAKLLLLGACTGVVAWVVPGGLRDYLLALGIAFPLFLLHQVTQVVRALGRMDAGGPSPEGRRSSGGAENGR